MPKYIEHLNYKRILRFYINEKDVKLNRIPRITTNSKFKLHPNELDHILTVRNKDLIFIGRPTVIGVL